MGQLSDVLQLRVTPELSARLRSEAARLGLRPADVARMALARAVTEGEAIGNRLELADGQQGAEDGKANESR